MGSRGSRPPWIFKHGTDIEDSAILTFFVFLIGAPNAHHVFILRTSIVHKVHSLGAPSQSAFIDQLIQNSESNSP